MQVGEGIAVLVEFMEEDKKKKCDFKPEQKTWKAKLVGKGGTLGDNIGSRPNATCVAELSSSCFPSQAHHLIPNARLNPKAKGAEDEPPHSVHEFLIDGDYLYADTDYDINHKKNGKWMPYAHALKEWKTGATLKKDKAYNKDIMFKVMQVANIQMHQGAHSYKKFGVGEAGYLKRVNQYLDKIDDNALSHYAGVFECDDCKSKEQSGKFPPRANIIRYMDKASSLIKTDINKCRIFVSEAASKFHEDIGFILEE
jgi:hypothetical protein